MTRSVRYPVPDVRYQRNTQAPRVFIVLQHTEGWAPLRCHSNKEIFGTEPPEASIF
jgi:hypothetical protein